MKQTCEEHYCHDGFDKFHHLFFGLFFSNEDGHIVSVTLMFFYEKSRNHTFIIYVVPAYVELLLSFLF